MAGRARRIRSETPVRWFGVTELPLTGSGKIQKFRLREQINRAELKDLATGQVPGANTDRSLADWLRQPPALTRVIL